MVTIEEITLSYGPHNNPEDGMCLLEAASYLSNEPFSYRPKCVSPVVAAFGIRINDKISDNETRDKWLKPLLPVLLNTVGSTALEQRRMFRCVDWAVREIAPFILGVVGRNDHAKTLRELSPIVDISTADTAHGATTAAAAAAHRVAIYAAANAAYAAANYTATDAANYTAATAAAADAAVSSYAASDDKKDIIYQMIVDFIKELCEMKDV